MTSHERDFDRLARAWLELGPTEAPDRSIAAVLQAIETTPQARRPWRWPVWRSPTMSRITILAVLAGTIALIVGGLVLSGSGNQGVPVVPVSPSPSPTVSTRPGSLGAPLPEAVKGGWSAASRGTLMEGADTDVTTIMLGGSSVDSSAPLFSLDWPGMPTRRLGSNVVEEEPGVLLFVLSSPGLSGCEIRSQGRYRWSVSEDGQWLTLDPISEACPVRGDILPGTWQRNVAFSYAGGPGIAVNFEPYVAMTLPAQPWTGLEYYDTDTVHTNSGDRGFKIWKDLDGFVDPCDRGVGRLDLDPGMDAFLAYLRDDPRFTDHQETEMEIDGHRAVEVRFQLGADFSEPCWDFDGDPTNKRGVLLWIPAAERNLQAFWNGELDTQGIATVTEVDGVAYVFEAVNVKPGEDLTSDREVLDTVRFLDALPTPPPS
jgi:hypothetical protein